WNYDRFITYIKTKGDIVDQPGKLWSSSLKKICEDNRFPIRSQRKARFLLNQRAKDSKTKKNEHTVVNNPYETPRTSSYLGELPSVSVIVSPPSKGLSKVSIMNIWDCLHKRLKDLPKYRQVYCNIFNTSKTQFRI
ncbi:1823_t:CDS:1, partial [Racocetra fulgida]